MMKTQLYSLPDWKSVLMNIGWADAPTQEDVDKIVLQELTRGKVAYAEQDLTVPIEKGSRVTLRTESVLPKFNKEKTVITVGTGLYEPSLEAQLCGMKAGSSAQATVKGEKVTFTVLKVEKKSYPALTDALVQDLQLDGITSLTAYYSYMENKIKMEYAAGLTKKVVEQLVSTARMDQPVEEDIRHVIDNEYEPLRVRFSLDTLSPEKWKEDFGRVELGQFYAQIYPEVANLFGTTGKESYYESRKEAAAQTIRNCMVLRSILADDTDSTDPTENPQAEQKLMQAMNERLLQIIYGG